MTPEKGIANMATYQKVISDKLTTMFHDAETTGDWAGCFQRVNRLVLAEKDQSFRSGLRWAQQRRSSRVQVEEEIPVA